MKKLEIEKLNRRVKKHSAKVQNRKRKPLSKIISLNDHLSDVLESALMEGTIRGCTHPLFIFTPKNKKPELIGTSILMQFDEQTYYLISAYHVFHHSIREESNLYIGSSSKGFTELQGKLSHTRDDPKNSDLAVIELSPNLVSERKLGYISQKKVILKKDLTNGDLFFTYGFPISKNKQSSSIKDDNTFEVSDFTYRGTVLLPTSTSKQENTVIGTHLKMKFDKKNCLINNRKINPPKLNGMSGGGLWVTIDSLKEDDTYLAGILIEYSKSDKIITFTKSSVILELINKLKK